MSRVDRLRLAALPVLDIMQTMPIFVYLIPFVMLFGPGKIPALLATIVFAIPPGSPAAKSDPKPGDVILAVVGHAVASPQDLPNEIRS